MDAPGLASLIHTYRQNLSEMRESNDPNGSEVTNLCSLGVVDLDLSLCPDVFGLKAFDENMPITRMLPGSSPCELRLLLPDTNIGKNGFHDVVVENLIGSRNVSPTLAKSRIPGDEGTRYRISGSTATSIYWTTMGISIRPSGLLPGVQNQDRWFTGVAYDVLPSRLGPALALPSRVVCSVERLRPRVPGSFQ